MNHKRLGQELQRGKLTQNAWALRFGLSKSYLSELVNGKRRHPSRSTREALLRGLNLEFKDLFEVEWDEARIDRPRPAGRLMDWAALGFRFRLDRIYKPEEEREKMFDNFWQDVRFALRTFWRARLFTAVALTTLALGIGVNVASFALVRGVLLRSLPFPNPDELVVLDREQFYSNRDLEEISAKSSLLEAVGAMSPGWSVALIEPGNSTQLLGARVSSNLFDVLGVSFSLGRGFSLEEGVPGQDQVVVISHRLWQDRYESDPDLLSKSVQIDGESYRFIGVLPPNFELLQPETDLWMTLPRDQSAWYYTSNLNWLVARRASNSTWSQVQAEIDRLLEGLREKFNLPDRYAAGIRATSLLEGQIISFRPLILALFAASLIVLLITSLNLANLVLTRLNTRRRELALRQALGAGHQRLRFQLLTEAGLLAFLGALLGILLAPVAVELLLNLLPADLPRRAEIGLDAHTLGFGATASLFVWLLLGFMPALLLRGRNLRGSLLSESDATTPAYRRSWSRSALVISEIMLAQALIIAAGLMIHSVWRLSHIDPGFDTHQIYTFGVQPSGENYREDSARRQYYDRLREGLLAIPGVQSVGSSQHLPLTGFSWSTDVEFEGRNMAASQTPPRLGWRVVDQGFLGTLRIPLIEGRYFDSRDRVGSEAVVIVNQAAARQFWPEESPLGKRLKGGSATGNGWARVIGIIGDIKHGSLASNPEPSIYLPYSQRSLVAMSFVVRTERPQGLVNSVRKVVWSIDDLVPIYQEKTFDQIIDDSIAQSRLLSLLLGIFAGLGLLVGVIGVYGLVAFGVVQRTREFGIRMAIGAQRRQVLSMVVKQGLFLTAVGILLGICLGLASSRLISDLLFEIESYDPSTYLVVSLILGLAATLASYLPARRATHIDPGRALR